MTRISIIMPAFDREAYVAEAIDSVLAQTYEDWELIVVDDGSTDETLSIATTYAHGHPRKIRVLSRAHGGVVAARNAGIEVAEGGFVAFLDSDDTWEPDKLASQIAVFDAEPHAAFVYTGFSEVDANGSVVRKVLPDSRFQGEILELLWLADNEILGATLLVRRSTLLAVGMFDSRLEGAENLALRLRLAETGPIRFVDRSLYNYRRHGSNLSSDRSRMLDERRKIIEAYLDRRDSGYGALFRRKVKARHDRLAGDLAFETEEFGAALGRYAKAVPFVPGRGDVLIRMVRCVLGSTGNRVLRRLKQAVVGATAR